MAKNIFFIILALPLLISQFLFFPASWGKATVFRILIIFLIYVFIYYLVFKKIKIDVSQIKKTKILWLFGLLFILTITSTIFSQDPYFSFWGDPQRAGGSLNFMLFLIFAVVAFVFIDKNSWNKIWDFNFIIASIIAALAIIIPSNYRPASTMGGPAILALYLALLIPLALSLYFTTKRKLYLLCAGLFFATILLTSSRGVLLGLLASFLYFIFSYKQKRWLKLAGVFLVLLFLAGIFFLRPVSIQDRVSVWTISLNALKERPLLGFGPENFSIAFDKYYQRPLTEWFDRAHNIVFDISIPYGIPFLIIYFLIFAILFFKVPSLAVKSCFIIYFVSNLFNFDVFPTYLIIFLLLAYSMSLVYKSPLLHQETKGTNPFLQTAMIIVFILFFSFAWVSSLKPLYINKEVNEARYFADNKEFEKSIEKLDALLSKHSIIDNYVRINYAITASRLIIFEPSLEKTLPLMEKSIKALEEAAKLRPKYARTWYMLNVFSNAFLKYEPSEQIKQKALYYCQRAKELSPNHPLIIQECQKTESLL